jgi:hypothetical protein
MSLFSSVDMPSSPHLRYTLFSHSSSPIFILFTIAVRVIFDTSAYHLQRVYALSYTEKHIALDAY